MEVEPNTRYVRWYKCGCREIEDSDSIQWETGPDPLCGDADGHPHGKLLKEVFQRARPVVITNTEWQFDEPE